MKNKLISGLLGLTLLAASPAFAQEELKVSSFVPADDALVEVIKAWADNITEKSNGAVTFAYFPSSQMGPPDRQYDLARTGVADISLIIHGFSPGRFPMTELTYLPDTFTGMSAADGAKAIWSVASYLEDEHVGTKLLGIAPTPDALIFSRSPYPTLDSLSGQRIRTAGAAMGDTVQALNAVPVGVPSPEMADSLQKGLIDALGLTYQAVADWKIDDSSKDLLDVSLGVVTFGVVMNRARYDSLPDAVKKLIDETSGEAMSVALGAELDAAEVVAKEELATHFDVVSLSGEDAKALEDIYAKRKKDGVISASKDGRPAAEFYSKLTDAIAAAR